jgi:hypothetical protein
MLILTAGHISLVLISPPGELTSMVYFMFAIVRLYFETKLDVMKECDAPESNKIVTGCELARNIPIPHLVLAELHRLSYGLPCHT